MAYFHGVKAGEVATSIVSPAQTTAGFPVVFGTAPIHLTDNPAAYVNKPTILYSYEEGKKKFGYSNDWDKFTLSEVLYAQFNLYAVAPICFVNVLDPAKHKTAVTNAEQALSADKTVTIKEPVLLGTLAVRTSTEADPKVLNEDYTAAYNDDGELVITMINVAADVTSIFVSYDKLDPSLVDDDDKLEAFNLIDSIYPRLSIVPGVLAAPGWTQNPTIAASLKAHALNIMGLFRCICLTDIDTTQATSYDAVNTWKNNNNYTGTNQYACWPCVRNGDHVFHMSTHLIGMIGVMDAANGDVPYQSPSNRTMQITGTCLKDGTEVNLSLDQANLLNSQGIYTALNFTGGWKGWGNRTAAYPSNTDVKDCFGCVRRMFDWQYQTFILTYWQKVDQPLTRRLVKTIVDSEQIRLNGLTARGYLLGASVQFLEEENPLTDLLNGIFRVHTYITPPVPAEQIEDVLEYDVNNFRALFND